MYNVIIELKPVFNVTLLSLVEGGNGKCGPRALLFFLPEGWSGAQRNIGSRAEKIMMPKEKILTQNRLKSGFLVPYLFSKSFCQGLGWFDLFCSF